NKDELALEYYRRPELQSYTESLNQLFTNESIIKEYISAIEDLFLFSNQNNFLSFLQNNIRFLKFFEENFVTLESVSNRYNKYLFCTEIISTIKRYKNPPDKLKNNAYAKLQDIIMGCIFDTPSKESFSINDLSYIDPTFIFENYNLLPENIRSLANIYYTTIDFNENAMLNDNCTQNEAIW